MLGEGYLTCAAGSPSRRVPPLVRMILEGVHTFEHRKTWKAGSKVSFAVSGVDVVIRLLLATPSSIERM